MNGKQMIENDVSTEEKIKIAARKLFQEKGFDGTKTRDIAKESGINIALLNYYFRSKQKLFEIIAAEAVKDLFFNLLTILENEDSTIDHKLSQFVEHHVDLLKSNPNLIHFVLSSSHENNPTVESLLNDFKIKAIQSSFASQYIQYAKENKLSESPVHYLLNIVSLTVFPLMIKRLFEGGFDIDPKIYDELLEERKILIPKWIKGMSEA